MQKYRKMLARAVARALIGGRGCIFIYSGSARLVSFEIKLISKEVSRAGPEYMNKHPSPPPVSVLATALMLAECKFVNICFIATKVSKLAKK